MGARDGREPPTLAVPLQTKTFAGTPDLNGFSSHSQIPNFHALLLSCSCTLSGRHWRARTYTPTLVQHPFLNPEPILAA